MRHFRLPDLLRNARVACVLAGALAVGGMAGCCGLGGPLPSCESPPEVVYCPPGHGPHGTRCPNPRSCQHCRTAGPEACEAEHGAHRRPVHRLAHHLKPDGPLQPQVPMAPLPKFHPLPVKPVFEPSYFDTVVGPAETPPYPGPPELAPVPPREF